MSKMMNKTCRIFPFDGMLQSVCGLNVSLSVNIICCVFLS